MVLARIGPWFEMTRRRVPNLALGMLLAASLIQGCWPRSRIKIASNTMAPAIPNGSHVIVGSGEALERFDIVVTRAPESRIHTIDDNGHLFCRRVIGLPGETIVLKDGLLSSVDGVPSQDYPGASADEGARSERYYIPEGRYFVLADRRSHSLDSRYFGPVKSSDILGRVLSVSR